MKPASLSTLLALCLLVLPAQARAGVTASEPAEASEHHLPISFVRAHSLGRAEARERVQQLLTYWGERFGVQGFWTGNTVRVVGRLFGVAFEARLVVGDDRVVAEASDPGFFMRGAAIDYINRKLGKYLNPRYEES
ncbi:MAG: polyhydroxyalkanoic acid system family protein [Myxococcaceae bacterium]|nr:polyhydroxyalkanoic acid system family protein [Myxococcaceae bacterium]